MLGIIVFYIRAGFNRACSGNEVIRWSVRIKDFIHNVLIDFRNIYIER